MSESERTDQILALTDLLKFLHGINNENLYKAVATKLDRLIGG